MLPQFVHCVECVIMVLQPHLKLISYLVLTCNSRKKGRNEECIASWCCFSQVIMEEGVQDKTRRCTQYGYTRIRM